MHAIGRLRRPTLFLFHGLHGGLTVVLLVVLVVVLVLAYRSSRR